MEFDIKPCTQYLGITGSHAYGTATETSDYDVRGWAIPPRKYFLAFDKHFEQHDEGYSFERYPFSDLLQQYITKNKYRQPAPKEEIDNSIYDIRKFFKLAADCNPSVIDILFLDEAEVLYCTDLGKIVRDNRDLFLSAKAKHTFTGYAVSQLKRINTHRRWLLNPIKEKPERYKYGLPECSVVTPEQRGAAEALVTAQIRSWLLQDSEIDQTELSIFHDKLTDFLSRILSSKDLIIQFSNEKEMVKATRIAAMEKLGMGKNYIAILQAEKEYHDRLTEWNQYQSWLKNRNVERAKTEAAHGLDLKHAAHLVRLLVCGKELLTTGKLIVKWRDTTLLSDIRKGAWTYEQIIEFLKKTDAEMQEIYDNKKYVVPHKPAMNKLSELCEQIVSKTLE